MKFLSYIRAIVYIPLGSLITVVISIYVVIGTYINRTPEYVSNVQRFWARFVLKLCGVSVRVEGLENIDGASGLFLFNHSSLFDIPVLYGYLPGHPRFGAKVELFSIPFFGAAMKRCGALPIVRSNRAQVLKLYQDSIERVYQGENFILAPEGTRQRAGTRLGPFKSGPFIFAISGQFPVLPVLIYGSHEILPKKTWWVNWGVWKKEVVLQILEPIPTQGYTLDTRPEFQHKVRTVMDKAYTEGQKQY